MNARVRSGTGRRLPAIRTAPLRSTWQTPRPAIRYATLSAALWAASFAGAAPAADTPAPAVGAQAAVTNAAAAAPAPARPKPVATPLIHATVEQPRAYGHTVGDLLQQRIALGTPAAPFALAELPRIGRVGTSLWRRRSEEQVDRRGQHWLTIEYQLINTPQSLGVWYLPVLKLKSQDGAAVLGVDRAPFSIGPFTPPQPYEVAQLPALQPDAAPAPVSLQPFARRIRIATRTLGAILLLWGGLIGWRHLRRGRHLPFARAVRDLNANGVSSQADPLAPRRRLLHALNDTAGEVVRPGTLAQLIARAPYLASEQASLQNFVQESHAVFFGGRALEPATDAAGVGALARRLRRLEQRHAA